MARKKTTQRKLSRRPKLKAEAYKRATIEDLRKRPPPPPRTPDEARALARVILNDTIGRAMFDPNFDVEQLLARADAERAVERESLVAEIRSEARTKAGPDQRRLRDVPVEEIVTFIGTLKTAAHHSRAWLANEVKVKLALKDHVKNVDTYLKVRNLKPSTPPS